MPEFHMPSLGADMDFGRVVEWAVGPGDRVRRGAVIVEVETDKGTFEVESPYDGVVERLIVQNGSRVPVGTVLASIRADEAAVVAEAGIPPPSMAAPLRELPAAELALPARAAIPPESPEAAAPRTRRRVSPLARRIAESSGVDLDAITGTGAEGAITRADVERAAAAAPGPPRAAPSAESGMRRAIAAAVSRSKREIPHYYLATDVDFGPAATWLLARNAAVSPAERVLPSVLVLKAVALSLEQYPRLNGFWRDDAFHPGDGVHLGVAIALRGGGLMAPAVHDANRRSLAELMALVRDLVQRARTGGLRGSEMTDATSTVTSLGDQGVTSVFGIIYPPQVAIVGFGKITERPWAEQGMLAVRPVLTATLAADHRVTDGHYGGLFLADVARRLRAPESL
jgi:pyruvate dehydrogenase E2 component (dihydrolipoamide acetyltransferase)